MAKLVEAIKENKSKRSGPPNRMNDLNYSTWMKFQKSFFRFESIQTLIEEYVHFFTKATWPEGDHSNTLIIGFDQFNVSEIQAPRNLVHYNNVSEMSEVLDALKKESEKLNYYDLVLIDMFNCLIDMKDLEIFLDEYSDEVFTIMKNILKPERYCSIFVNMEGIGGGGFPIPWAVAKASRSYLRLRDEKVGLRELENTIFYCLIMQQKEDEDQGHKINTKNIKICNDTAVPGWTIPTAPPRKKNEILHPAKYPETLVKEFIELFTEQGDNVLDPMVGTGSTVVASIETERNGYGIELNKKYADIALKRVEEKYEPTLFEEYLPQVEGIIINGDASNLNEIDELKGQLFNYCITSPPYWSMLSNKGSENQRKRRKQKLDIVYSEDENDLGNISNYEDFLNKLVEIYNNISEYLVEGSYMTIVVKNIKRDHIVYPFAWDLVSELCGTDGKYSYAGTTLWCQDNIGLKPFAVGTHWVSNTLHNYCLHLKKR
ncbi:DNA methyltransferase [Salirhabdus sp. Marseille-P4669]|uniref:DNA methyltransferase n=1 Tax=Salirhabdus sp. Marseille-P4669 TaxID=2042310 RepID=UPI000C7A22AB|nr:DNA methyltransferase [Salirhabdus sp. Marseille-P4669]